MKCLLLLVLLAMVSVTNAAYNFGFCDQNIGQINSTGFRQQRPVFFDNFYVFMERKETTLSVSFSELYYSQAGGLVYANQLSSAGQNQMWVDTQFDEIMIAPLDPNALCTDTPFQGSDMYTFLRAQVNNGSVILNNPYILFGWDASVIQNISYLGESSSRGIATQQWITCEYFTADDTTMVKTWDIVDSSQFRMPVVSDTDAEYAPVLPISTSVMYLQYINNTYVQTLTKIDYTHFARIDQTDRHFEIPPDMLCAKKPNSQKPLPVIPDYFKFKAEQVTFSNYGTASQSAASLVYTKVEYRKIMGIYIQDYVTTPVGRNSAVDKSYQRVVDDYNTGITYSLDLSTGFCQVTPISQYHLDTYDLGNGMVRMRSSDEFFDLDNEKYQYMGIHKVRGIDCDTWSTFMTDNKPDHNQNTQYTWYFANPDWMMNNGYYKPWSMPVMLEYQQPSANQKDVTYVQFHVYEFSTTPKKDFPNLANCFLPNQTLNIEIYFKGRFDVYYAKDPGDFQQNFMGAFVAATQLPSPLRLTDIDFQPANNNQIVVRFKLLEQLNVKGDVGTKPDKTPSQTILKNLKQKVDAGQFFIDVGTDGKVTLYAIPGSANVIPSVDKFASTGSYTAGSSGFSAGSMAGIGIGMVVLGVVIGILVVFLVKKFRRTGDDTIAMSTSS
ncbi:unnamed protein product [Lymnaea stagnalis]|uniref:Transmembrane protein n=1 Tax=Lymnaea stagnalis TaxID=6523 RepID=A0AAV2H3M2_LYMST